MFEGLFWAFVLLAAGLGLVVLELFIPSGGLLGSPGRGRLSGIDVRGDQVRQLDKRGDLRGRRDRGHHCRDLAGDQMVAAFGDRKENRARTADRQGRVPG